MALSGSSAPDIAAMASEVMPPPLGTGGGLSGRPRGRARCPDRLGKHGERPGQVLVGYRGQRNKI